MSSLVLRVLNNSFLTKKLSPAMALFLVAITSSIVLFFLHIPLDKLFEMEVPMDFEVPILARDRIVQGINPYVVTEFLPYKYSPFALIPMIPLPSNHSMAWFYYKIICLLSLACTLLYGFRPITWKRVGLAALGIVLAWKGYTTVLYYGQLEFLMFFLAIMAAVVFRRSVFFGALLIGMMPWLKLPFGFLFIPFFIEASRISIREKSYKTVVQFSVGLMVSALLYGLLIPGAVFGFAKTIEHTQNWYIMLKVQPQSLFEEPLNQSVWIAAVRWLGPIGQTLYIKLAIALSIVASMGLLMVRHMKKWTPENPLAWITPWILLNQIINPLAWVWGGLYVMGIPLALEGSESESKPSQPAWLKITLWICVLAGLLLQQRGLPQLLGQVTWEGLFQYSSLTFYWLALLGLVL